MFHLFLFFYCLFISLFAFTLKYLTKSFPRSLARTQIICLVSYKRRSIALILIVHVFKYMQIQIAFRQYNNQKLYSLKYIHMYIFVCLFFIETAGFDFNDFHTRM